MQLSDETLKAREKLLLQFVAKVTQYQALTGASLREVALDIDVEQTTLSSWMRGANRGVKRTPRHLKAMETLDALLVMAKEDARRGLPQKRAEKTPAEPKPQVQFVPRPPGTTPRVWPGRLMAFGLGVATGVAAGAAALTAL